MSLSQVAGSNSPRAPEVESQIHRVGKEARKKVLLSGKKHLNDVAVLLPIQQTLNPFGFRMKWQGSVFLGLAGMKEAHLC